MTTTDSGGRRNCLTCGAEPTSSEEACNAVGSFRTSPARKSEPGPRQDEDNPTYAGWVMALVVGVIVILFIMFAVNLNNSLTDAFDGDMGDWNIESGVSTTFTDTE